MAFAGTKIHDLCNRPIGLIRVQRSQAEMSSFAIGDRRFRGLGGGDRGLAGVSVESYLSLKHNLA